MNSTLLQALSISLARELEPLWESDIKPYLEQAKAELKDFIREEIKDAHKKENEQWPVKSE